MSREWKGYEAQQEEKARCLEKKYRKVGPGNYPSVAEGRLMQKYRRRRKSWWQRYCEWSDHNSYLYYRY